MALKLDGGNEICIIIDIRDIFNLDDLIVMLVLSKILRI